MERDRSGQLRKPPFALASRSSQWRTLQAKFARAGMEWAACLVSIWSGSQACPSFAPCVATLVTSQYTAHGRSKPGKFTGQSPPQKKTMAVVVQAKSRREAKRPVGRQIPGHDGSEIVGSVWQTEAVKVAKASVHFNSGDEVLAAQIAMVCRGLQREWPAGADGVSELPRIAPGEVLGGQRIQREVPATVPAREQELALEFVVVLLTRDSIRHGKVRFNIVTFYFFQDLVRFADLLVFDVQHGVDEMFALQQPKAVFNSKSGKDGALTEGALAIEIELRGPPRSRAIFKFHPEGVEVISPALRPKR